MADPDPPRDDDAPIDRVLVHGVTEDRKGLSVVRRRGEALELGEVRPVESGKPLTGDLVRLVPRPERPLLFDVKTEVAAPRPAEAPAPPRARPGPPMVATGAYRAGWDAIFGLPAPADPDEPSPPRGRPRDRRLLN